jgi:hypothetical protein
VASFCARELEEEREVKLRKSRENEEGQKVNKQKQTNARQRLLLDNHLLEKLTFNCKTRCI